MTTAPPPLRIAAFHELPSGGAKRPVHAQVREVVRRGQIVDGYVTSTAEERSSLWGKSPNEVDVVDVPEPADRQRMLAGRPMAEDLVPSLRL